MKFDDVKRAAHGRWSDIFSGLNIEVSRRHSACPGCGGKDRFRFDDRTGNGDFICNQMEGLSGDGFKLIQHVFGVTVKESFDMVAGYLGLEENKPLPVYKPPKIIQFKPKSDYALSLWRDASEGVSSHPYALGKGIDWEAGALRGRASGRVIGTNSDCLLIPIRNPKTWAVVAVQCINTEGKKQTFGAIKGSGFICGNTLDKSINWFVVEGWADAVSMVFHHYKGNAVAAAAMGGYEVQLALAEKLNVQFSPERIVIIKDKEMACG